MLVGELKIINPFTDIVDPAINPDGNYGADVLGNLKSIAYGSGVRSFNVDDDGMWMGAQKFVDAPFSVDMLGALIAATGNIAGWLITATLLYKGHLFFDSANERILVTDDTTNRIVIGNV